MEDNNNFSGFLGLSDKELRAVLPTKEERDAYAERGDYKAGMVRLVKGEGTSLDQRMMGLAFLQALRRLDSLKPLMMMAQILESSGMGLEVHEIKDTSMRDFVLESIGAKGSESKKKGN